MEIKQPYQWRFFIPLEELGLDLEGFSKLTRRIQVPDDKNLITKNILTGDMFSWNGSEWFYTEVPPGTLDDLHERGANTVREADEMLSRDYGL